MSGSKAKADQCEAHEGMKSSLHPTRPQQHMTKLFLLSGTITLPVTQQSQNPLFLESWTNLVPTKLIYGIHFLPKKKSTFNTDKSTIYLQDSRSYTLWRESQSWREITAAVDAAAAAIHWEWNREVGVWAWSHPNTCIMRLRSFHKLSWTLTASLHVPFAVLFLCNSFVATPPLLPICSSTSPRLWIRMIHPNSFVPRKGARSQNLGQNIFKIQ